MIHWKDQAVTVTVLRDYDRPLEIFLLFNYLGHLLTATYDYCMAVIFNLRKARKSCSCLDRILEREGIDTRTLGGFYVVVVHAILLSGLEMWVVTPHIKRIFGVFRHRVAEQISGNMPWRWTEVTWEYPHLGYAMRTAVFEEIKTYISRRHNMVVQHIATRHIIDLCLDT